MSTDIFDIKQKILDSNDNLFFLSPNIKYSIASRNFKNFFTVYRSKKPVLKDQLKLNADYTLSYTKNEQDDSNTQEGQIVLFVNTNTNTSFQALLEFKANTQFFINSFPVVLDKFLFTSKGTIYAAKDVNTIYQVYFNPTPTDQNNLDYLRINSITEPNTDSLIISSIRIPIAMSTVYSNTGNESMVQSIWNYENLIYDGGVESSLGGNVGNIRAGWFCQTGDYNRKDQLGNDVNMSCLNDYFNDDKSNLACIGDNGKTEFLYYFDDKINNGFRCNNYRNTESWKDNICGVEGTVVNKVCEDPYTPNDCKIYCQYAAWGFGDHPNDIGDSQISACAEGIGNIGALPRDSSNKLISEDKLSYKNCKLIYSTYIHDYNLQTEPSSFSPWSKATKNSQIYYDFCSEHDTLTNLPMFKSNSNCQKWALDINKDNPNVEKQLKNMYCSKYPQSNSNDVECGKVCSNKTLSCYDTFINTCKGDNLNLKSCQDFATSPNINLDEDIKAYCQTIGKENAITNDLCNCFMSDDFYINLFNGVKLATQDKQNDSIFKDKYGNSLDIFNRLSALSDYPTCYYSRCAAADVKPFSEKNSNTKKNCPNIAECVQVNKTDVNGNISANGITFGSQDCTLISSKDIPVDCKLSNWGYCENGIQTRTIVEPPQNGGKLCDIQYRYCSKESFFSTRNIYIIIIILIVIIIILFISKLT